CARGLYRLAQRSGAPALMFYATAHLARYRCSRPVRQSMMEVRMHPRSEGPQRCFTFRLSVNPRARIFSFADHLGNQVHHFDLPSHHRELTIVADALVSVDEPDHLPAALPMESWQELERVIGADDHWQMLAPSGYARPSSQLEAMARELKLDDPDGRDPLTLDASICQ